MNYNCVWWIIQIRTCCSSNRNGGKPTCTFLYVHNSKVPADSVGLVDGNDPQKVVGSSLVAVGSHHHPQECHLLGFQALWSPGGIRNWSEIPSKKKEFGHVQLHNLFM